MPDPRAQLLMAALGVAGCSMLSIRPRALTRSAPGSIPGPGSGTSRRHGSSGLRPPVDSVRREGLAGHLLHERDGALAHECDWHRMGADAVARGPECGVGGGRGSGEGCNAGRSGMKVIYKIT